MHECGGSLKREALFHSVWNLDGQDHRSESRKVASFVVGPWELFTVYSIMVTSYKLGLARRLAFLRFTQRLMTLLASLACTFSLPLQIAAPLSTLPLHPFLPRLVTTRDRNFDFTIG